MNTQTINFSFVEEHLHGMYLGSNHLNNPFSNKFNIYEGEFGKAHGWAGIKVQAACWRLFFKAKNLTITKVINDEEGIIVCEFIETANHISTFKTISPNSPKDILINGIVSLGIENNKITHYCLVKDISKLVSDLVGSDHERYSSVKNSPIFSNPYDLHLNVIIEYLKQNNIIVSLLQAKYLCGYFVGAINAETRETFGMPSPKENIFEGDVVQLFKSSSWEGVREKLYQLGLAELLVEGFTLLRGGQYSPCGDGTHRYALPEYLIDNSKYLL